MDWVLVIIVWLIFGAISYSLIHTGHWIVGALLITLLLFSTTIKHKE